MKNIIKNVLTKNTAIVLLAIIVLITGGCVNPQVQRQQLQEWVDWHSELSAEEKQLILNRKLFVGLPLEACKLMCSQGMVKKSEFVDGQGTFECWFNGWNYMYFRNDKLEMWRKCD